MEASFQDADKHTIDTYPFSDSLSRTTRSPGPNTITTFQRNIVGRSMLHALGQPVAMYCDEMDVVGVNLKAVKFFMQHLWMLYDVVAV